MFKYIFLITLLLLSVLCIKADNFAVLVAGSTGYENYRHQADVAHSFQLLLKNGFKKENIIVMMYDDIAHNWRNPKKGSIINEPGGPNVYPGVNKDYTHLHVTPHNFLKVLKGDKSTKRKVLETGPNDNIFVYFADHGAPGLIAFPFFETLHAKDLLKALHYMHEKKKYKQMVIYIEACESGSMFNNLLPKDVGIWATTASNPFESSYACYYDKTYKAYLADCYSINWMNHTEYHDIKTTTLEQQYEDVKRITTTSPTCLYGDISMKNEFIGQFQGGLKNKNFKNFVHKFVQNKNKNSNSNIEMRSQNFETFDKISSRDVHLVTLQRSLQETNDLELQNFYKNKIQKYLKQKENADLIWNSFKGMLNLKTKEKVFSKNEDDRCHDKELKIDVDCMKNVVDYSNKFLGNFNEYSIKYATYLNEACQQKVPTFEIRNTLQKISKVLKH